MKEKIKKIIKAVSKTLFFVAIVLTVAMFWYGQYNFYFADRDTPSEYSAETECPANSNVAVIKIYGDISTYRESADSDSVLALSDEILGYIDQIKEDSEAMAVVVEIDSYGGSPAASAGIMQALKEIGKPTVALIKEGAVSGGYFIATGANKIYANKMSNVGGIGITMSYLDHSQQNKKEGIIYRQLSAGKFKDTGDPDKELTAAEQEFLMRDVKKLHQLFVEMVAENRNLDIKAVEKIADGSTMLGPDAKEAGLIDEIGGIEDVKNYLQTQLGVEPKLCVY